MEGLNGQSFIVFVLSIFTRTERVFKVTSGMRAQAHTRTMTEMEDEEDERMRMTGEDGEGVPCRTFFRHPQPR